MISKRFLVPVLAFLGFGLPAGAAIVTAYCDGGGCGTNTIAAFNAIVSTPAYTYANVTDFTFTGSLLSSTEYDDATTLTQFFDTKVNGVFATSGGVLQTKNQNADSVQVTIPAAYSAIVMSISTANGAFGLFCLDGPCDNVAVPPGTSARVGYINSGSGSWNIALSVASGNPQLAISGFDVASPGMSGSETPEIGTLLLIGSGLIAMRWMRRVPRRIFRSLQPA